MKRPATDPLEDRLRAEAEQLRAVNGFSPILHQRIMTALKQQGLAGMPVRAEGTRTLWRYIGPVAAAAAIGLAAWIAFQPASTDNTSKIARSQPGKLPAPMMPPSPALPSVPPVPYVALASPVDPTTTALEERKYAYLDRDARKLFTFVADQLPGFPAGPGAPK